MKAVRLREFARKNTHGIVSLFDLLLFFTVTAAFLLPLAKAFSPLFTGSPADGKSAISAARLLKTILFTLAQSLCSVFLALLAGVPLAYFVAKRRFPGRRFLLSLATIPFCIPTLIMALGYISTFGMAGHANRILMSVFNLSEPPLKFLYSFWGIVLTQGFYNFPLVMVTVADSWAKLDRTEEDCARLLGASEAKVFWSITAYKLLPAATSACIPIFLYCFFSFVIIMMFGAPGTTTLEAALYHAGRTVLDFKSAAILALTETLCAFALLSIYSFAEKKGIKSTGLSFASIKNTDAKITKKEIPFAIFLFATVAVFFLLPLFSIFLSTFTARSHGKTILTLATWKNLFKAKSFYSALRNTLTTAVFSATLSTVAASVPAIFLRLRQNSQSARQTLGRTLALLPMAVSPVVLGLGLTMLYPKGSPLLLVLCQASLNWPFAFRQIFAAVSKTEQNEIGSAILLGTKKSDCIFSVIVPQSARAFFSAWGFCFALSAGDTTLPLVLSLYKFDTLSLLTYRLAGSYRFSQACACGLVLGLLCTLTFSLSTKLKERKKWNS